MTNSLSLGEVFFAISAFLLVATDARGEGLRGRQGRGLAVCTAVCECRQGPIKETVVFNLPITTSLLASPKFSRCPQIESQRVGLETPFPQNVVMAGRINTDIMERSYVLGRNSHAILLAQFRPSHSRFQSSA